MINYRIRVTLNDGRALVGQLLAFDKNLNLVLKECSEERVVKKKGGKAVDGDDEEEAIRRTLGLVILRGDSIVTLTVEGPPPVEDDSKGPQVRCVSAHSPRCCCDAPLSRPRSLTSRCNRSELDLESVDPLDVAWDCRRLRCESSGFEPG